MKSFLVLMTWRSFRAPSEALVRGAGYIVARPRHRALSAPLNGARQNPNLSCWPRPCPR